MCGVATQKVGTRRRPAPQVREPVSRTWAPCHYLGTEGRGWWGVAHGGEGAQAVQRSGIRGKLRKEEHGDTFEVI